MDKNYFADIQIGSRVWHFYCGWGTVVDMRDYEFMVRPDDDNLGFYWRDYRGMVKFNHAKWVQDTFWDEKK